MSSSVCAHRLLLTKEALRDYKYNQLIFKYAVQIRDTICDDIEKGNVLCDKQTKYAFKLDQQQAVAYKGAVQIHHKSRVHIDVITQLRHFFPDSTISLEERDQLDGFTVTNGTYIEVDWS
jgi:hypothetical protein